MACHARQACLALRRPSAGIYAECGSLLVPLALTQERSEVEGPPPCGVRRLAAAFLGRGLPRPIRRRLRTVAARPSKLGRQTAVPRHRTPQSGEPPFDYTQDKPHSTARLVTLPAGCGIFLLRYAVRLPFGFAQDKKPCPDALANLKFQLGQHLHSVVVDGSRHRPI